MFHVKHLDNCPICNFQESGTFLSIRDYSVTQEIFTISKCSKCGFLFTNPRPNKTDIDRYYESEDYISHTNTRKGFFNKIYHLIKGIALRQKIGLINSLIPPGKKILDIGCGTGSFLNAIRENGWESIGMEPNKRARDEAKNYGLEVFEEINQEKFVNNSFSIITMWHVLEHVHDLNKRVKEIYNLLADKGFALIALPNHTSYDSKHYNESWAAYDVPRHLYHFSPENVKTLFLQHNLFHVKSFPMKFDAFYVSLLSEKYKRSTIGPVKAFYNGLRSNLQAGSNAEKYSSVIYVFQKNSTSTR